MTQATPSTTIRLFIVTGVDRLPPTYIAAASEDDARRVFVEFMTHRAPFHRGEIRHVSEPGANWLANRPQLSAAINDANDRGEAGVAWWLGHREGWLVQRAAAQPAGSLSAQAPDVRYYRLDDDKGLDVAVFAFDKDEAVLIFQIWHMTMFGRYREAFSIRRVSPWLLIGDQLSLRENMHIGLVGIGAQLANGDWRIVQPDEDGVFE